MKTDVLCVAVFRDGAAVKTENDGNWGRIIYKRRARGKRPTLSSENINFPELNIKEGLFNFSAPNRAHALLPFSRVPNLESVVSNVRMNSKLTLVEPKEFKSTFFRLLEFH